MGEIKRGRPASKTRMEFARRLSVAADNNPRLSAPNYGRYPEIVRLLAVHDIQVTPEAVRRWFSGESRLIDENIAALSKVLGVDYEWLAHGIGDDSGLLKKVEGARPDIPRSTTIDVGAHLLIGLAAAGGAAVFRGDGDMVHAKIQIRGAEYACHGVFAEVDGDRVTFVVPRAAENTVIIGIEQTSPMCFKTYELDWDVLVEKADPTVAETLTVHFRKKDNPFRQIKGFDRRL